MYFKKNSSFSKYSELAHQKTVKLKIQEGSLLKFVTFIGDFQPNSFPN